MTQEQAAHPGQESADHGAPRPAPPARHLRRLAALDAQLRQQGAVIEAYRAKLRHATERAEADERLLAEQAALLVKMALDHKVAVQNLHDLLCECDTPLVP